MRSIWLSAFLAFVLFPVFLFGQGAWSNSQTLNTNGGLITVTPAISSPTSVAFRETVFGIPTSITVTIQGCASGSCTTVSTNSSSGNSTYNTSLSSPTYTTYQMSATWTGGIFVFVTIDTTATGPAPTYPSSGGIASVAGTANQITVTNGNSTPVISLPSNAVLPGSPTIASPPASTDNSTKAATTNFVRKMLGYLNPALAVQIATITVLPDSPAYSNGTAGVGATLTATSNGALVIDGYTVLLGDRVLVNNQANQIQNGVYTQTTVGTVSVEYVLTRATDFNTVAEINNAGSVPSTNGTSCPSTCTWQLDSGISAIGTSNILYDQTTGAPPVAPMHSIGATFSGGGAQSTQVYCCYTAANGGTIKAWNITVDDGTGSGTCGSCTATVKFWRVASGTSTPSSSNSISTSGVSLASGTHIHSITLTDFTSLAVSANDVFAIQLSAVANAVIVTADFQYQ